MPARWHRGGVQSIDLSTQATEGFHYTFDPRAEALCTVAPGEGVVIESEDSYHGQLFAHGHRDRELEPRSNPLSGPIAVEGATPGDAVAVHIEAIEPLEDRASTYLPSWWWYLGPMGSRTLMDELLDVSPTREGVILPITEGDGDAAAVHLGDARVPYAPMVGTVGTAPVDPVPNGGAGPHGGNMDLPCLGPDATIYLPVRVPGAQVFLGDVHAAQGEAEVTGVAAEMRARTTVRVDIVEGLTLSWPRIETPSHRYAVAATTDFSGLADAIRVAYVALVAWLVEEGMSRDAALRLVGIGGDLLVGNVNCVAAGIADAYLPADLRA